MGWGKHPETRCLLQSSFLKTSLGLSEGHTETWYSTEVILVILGTGAYTSDLFKGILSGVP